MAKTYTFPCTLTSYEHYYAVGSNGVTVAGGNMKASADQSVFAVGGYSRSSGNNYSAIMVTLPALTYRGDVQSAALRLYTTTNNGNAVYLGQVTDTSNLANTGATPWYTGSTVGWIETSVADLGYGSGVAYSLIQDANNTGSLDIVVTQAELVITTDAPEGNIWVQTASGSQAGLAYVQTASGPKEGTEYVMTENGLKQSS